MLKDVGKLPGHRDSFRVVRHQKPKVNVAGVWFQAGKAAPNPAATNDARGSQSGDYLVENATELLAACSDSSELLNNLFRRENVDPWLQFTIGVKMQF